MPDLRPCFLSHSSQPAHAVATVTAPAPLPVAPIAGISPPTPSQAVAAPVPAIPDLRAICTALVLTANALAPA